MDERYLILDTETTGIGANDEVIELGIIDMSGNTVYHSVFRPSCSIDPRAERVHGISLYEVADKPIFYNEFEKIKNILNGKKILIYNDDFDVRMLNQTARIHFQENLLSKSNTFCIMKSYARYNGQINPKTGRYKWIKLEQALINEGIPAFQTHRAIGDCLMTLALINKIGKIWEIN